jgi:N-acetyl sugar amidotransferase
MKAPARECTRCVMDDYAADIAFDGDGHCNYCSELISKLAIYQPTDPKTLQENLARFVERVRRDGWGKRYDCIVGVSGGADSAYALYLACKQGLRPLAVHMDNGWNSELAVNNIENLVRKLNVDLYTHVVDWREYRALQQAFFDADVIDVELLYDNAMLAVNYSLARQYHVRYILSGSNTTTEGMRMPRNFNWFKFDRSNIRDIARHNNVQVRSLPTIGVLAYCWHHLVIHTRWVPFLDFIDYEKQRCIDELVREVGYRPYPYKHYESIFTRFYQGYLLPVKFGVDKRRVHLSSLICSGQMTRDLACELLNQSPYPNPDDLQADIEYFLKKLGWSQANLNDYLSRQENPHDKYASDVALFNKLLQFKSKYLTAQKI